MSSFRVGKVSLDPSAFVAPGAVVVGQVSLGPRASVWFNTVVRGDVAEILVGEASNLQDNSTVHVDEGQPAVLGARVTVGHRAIVHGCAIEDDCLIGMGSVLLSGCRIGTGSLVGAGSLVREGMVVPPGSLVVGSPARVIGAVDEKHTAAIRRGSDTYAALARSYMSRGMARPVGRSGEISRDRQAMTAAEWTTRVQILDEAPERMAAALDRSRNGKSASESRALEVVGGIAVLDREARRPCVERLLRDLPASWEESHAEARGSAAGPPSDLAAALEDWRAERTALVEMLRPLGSGDWWRMAEHPTRGPFTLAELVREWVEEDFERARRITARAGEGV